MPKNTKPNWTQITNPETSVPALFPLNRTARRAFQKMHNTDVVPPPLYQPVVVPDSIRQEREYLRKTLKKENRKLLRGN